MLMKDVVSLSGPGEWVQVFVCGRIHRRSLWERCRWVRESALSEQGPVPRWRQRLPVPVPAWFLWKPVPGEWNSGSTHPDRPRHFSSQMRVLNLPVSFKASWEEKKFIIFTFSPQHNFFCDDRISLYSSFCIAATTNIVSLTAGNCYHLRATPQPYSFTKTRSSPFMSLLNINCCLLSF